MAIKKPFIKTLKTQKNFKRIWGNSLKKKGLSCGLVRLKMAQEIGSHSTKNKEEILIILKGRAEVSVEKKTFSLDKNTLLYIPPRTLHNVKNTGNSLLEYLYITAGV